LFFLLLLSCYYLTILLCLVLLVHSFYHPTFPANSYCSLCELVLQPLCLPPNTENLCVLITTSLSYFIWTEIFPQTTSRVTVPLWPAACKAQPGLVTWLCHLLWALGKLLNISGPLFIYRMEIIMVIITARSKIQCVFKALWWLFDVSTWFSWTTAPNYSIKLML
jgi:hypothetical protein